MILWRYPMNTLGHFMTDAGWDLFAFGVLLPWGQSGLFIGWLKRVRK